MKKNNKSKKEKPIQIKKHLEKNVEEGLFSNRDKGFIITFLVLILIIVGIIFTPKFIPQSWFKQETNNYVYNGFKIEQNEKGFWQTDLQKLGSNDVYSIEMRYDPRSIDTIKTEIKDNASINKIYYYPAVYVMFNPDDKNRTYMTLSAAEISTNLARVMDITPVAACTKNETDSCINRPIKTCDTLKGKEYAIYLNESPETSLIITNNCIIINGEGEDMLKTAEKYLYNLYGII